jgi:hypothetical protein
MNAILKSKYREKFIELLVYAKNELFWSFFIRLYLQMCMMLAVNIGLTYYTQAELT